VTMPETKADTPKGKLKCKLGSHLLSGKMAAIIEMTKKINKYGNNFHRLEASFKPRPTCAILNEPVFIYKE